MCAGRAAQRLQELLSGEEAKVISASTIHRLLGYRNRQALKRMSAAGTAVAKVAEFGKLLPEDGSETAADLDPGRKCQYNRSQPLPDGNFLVDEVSMMDTPLAAALFNALSTQGCQR
jgi:ATP-dependent exoDNAse (exonuclease V) alpha subunit